MKLQLDLKALIKNCPNILRAFKKLSANKSFRFCILFPTCNLAPSTSFMPLIASLWCFPLSYLSHLKIIWISFSVSFLPQISEVFVPYWRLYRLMVLITKLWDENLLLKLFKFRYLYFSKCSFVCIFFYKCIGGCVYNSPYLFFGKTYTCFYIPSYLAHLSTPWIYSRWG